MLHHIIHRVSTLYLILFYWSLKNKNKIVFPNLVFVIFDISRWISYIQEERNKNLSCVATIYRHCFNKTLGLHHCPFYHAQQFFIKNIVLFKPVLCISVNAKGKKPKQESEAKLNNAHICKTRELRFKNLLLFMIIFVVSMDLPSKNT